MSTAAIQNGRPEFVATYRLQLTADFTFADAAEQVPHISGLGVSHLYLSPIGTAMPGSTHGYDWVPPPAVAGVLGGIDGLRELRRVSSAAGLGVIVDIVPNHTGVEDPRENPWWWDVLTHGSSSDHANQFDIDWAPDNGADGKIALPVLGGPDDIDALTLDTDSSGTTELAFYEHRFPLAPDTDLTSARSAHDAQAYRLVPWNSGLIGYRRFFAVNGLAGMRQEDPSVYAATHTLIHQLVAEDLIDGLRVDHPDGLTDPVGYLEQLRSDIGDDRLLLIEKVLSSDEDLDPALPVDGTTGYEALRVLDGVFVDSTAAAAFTALHRRIVGNPGNREWIDAAEHAIKLTTLDEMFPAERARLSRAIRIAARDAGDTDPLAVSPADLDAAIGEVVASLGVYRADYPSLRPRLDTTFDHVRDRFPELGSALRLIAEAVSSDGEPSARLAQVCGATTAKSVEDCLFYRTARLVSLQEVGGDPGTFGTTVDAFHVFNIDRATNWPSAMTTLSTHDTKRGEDVRARIGLLSRHPDRWSALVEAMVSTTPSPDPVTGLFLIQNIVGVWPLDGPPDASVRKRLHEFTTKAIREAALVTSWTESDDATESAIHRWVDDIIDGPVGTEIATLISDLRTDIVDVCVAHKALGLLIPGFGDIYQGTEWFEDTLVDPDNRRPIDFDQPLDHPKTAMVVAALSVRRDHPSSFGPDGGYAPVHATGPIASDIVAFGRGDDVIVLAARTRIPESDAAAETVIELPAGPWRSRLGDGEFSGSVSVAELLAHGPVSILELRT